MTHQLSDEFFETLGGPRPEHPFDLLDAYRFDLCFRQMDSGSVLDVGAYLGDFLKLVIKDGREAFGSEINETRVKLVNSIVGSDVVRLGFRNGTLDAFEASSIDNVVCMETVEHIIDDKFAVSELCRVARKRVVITVPYREKVEQILCTHCNTFTPHHGHQHTYDDGSFKQLVPEGWKIVTEKSFAARITRMVRQLLPETKLSIPLLRWLDKVVPGSGRWLLVVLEVA